MNPVTFESSREHDAVRLAPRSINNRSASWRDLAGYDGLPLRSLAFEDCQNGGGMWLKCGQNAASGLPLKMALYLQLRGMLRCAKN
jgi:hypothetical protein